MAETVEISRSSLYYRRQPRASRADRSHDEQIITACGEKPAYGYRRVVWWFGRHHGLVVNGKRALRVMRERGLLVRQRRFQVSRRKDWGKVEAPHPNHVWQSDMTKVWAGPSAYVNDSKRAQAGNAHTTFASATALFYESHREVCSNTA